jgi:hypothetical protein
MTVVLKMLLSGESSMPFLLIGILAGLSSAMPAASASQSSTVVPMVNVDAELQKTVDARSAHKGDPIVVVLLNSAKLNDGTVLSKGALLQGHIDDVVVEPQKHGNSSIVLTLDKAQNKGGPEITVKTTVVHVRAAGTERINPLDSTSDGPGYAHSPSGPGLPQAPQGQSSMSARTTYSDIPKLSVGGSLQEKNSGTLTMKGQVLRLAKGTLVEVSVAVLPADGILAEQ